MLRVTIHIRIRTADGKQPYCRVVWAGCNRRIGHTTSAKEVAGALRNSGLGLSRAQMAKGLRFLRRIKRLIGPKIEAELFVQRVYLDFLKSLGLREEFVSKSSRGGRTGDILYHNLGTFSEVIADFEQIHLDLRANELYASFAGFRSTKLPVTTQKHGEKPAKKPPMPSNS